MNAFEASYNNGCPRPDLSSWGLAMPDHCFLDQPV